MNNLFTNNARFSSLIEDKQKVQNKQKSCNKKIDTIVEDNKKIDTIVEDNKKINQYNSFKSDQPLREYSSFNKNYRERKDEIMIRIENEEKKKKENEARVKEEEKRLALSIESFPELVVSNAKVIENTTNFLEKLNTKTNVSVQVKDVIQPGWTKLTRDKHSNSTIMLTNTKRDERIYVKTPEDLAYDVLEHLVYLHEKRRTEYIDSWGEDAWEQMFLFPNYDYHYFDKLDEIYEKNNIESDDEYENDENEEDEY